MKLIGTTARVLQKEDVDLYPVLANLLDLEIYIYQIL